MKFEYDPDKSQSNLRKHDIDFEMAQELWEGPYVEFAAKSPYENRFAVIGPIAGKLFTCIYTLRGESIRIISCRRSRRQEGVLYEKSL